MLQAETIQVGVLQTRITQIESLLTVLPQSEILENSDPIPLIGRPPIGPSGSNNRSGLRSVKVGSRTVSASFSSGFLVAAYIGTSTLQAGKSATINGKVVFVGKSGIFADGIYFLLAPLQPWEARTVVSSGMEELRKRSLISIGIPLMHSLHWVLITSYMQLRRGRRNLMLHLSSQNHGL
jgi:hypothetical protein